MNDVKRAAPIAPAIESGSELKTGYPPCFAKCSDNQSSTDLGGSQDTVLVFSPPQVPGRIFKCSLLQALTDSEALPTIDSLAAALGSDPDRVCLALFELCRDHSDLNLICVGDVVLLPIVAAEQLRHTGRG